MKLKAVVTSTTYTIQVPRGDMTTIMRYEDQYGTSITERIELGTMAHGIEYRVGPQGDGFINFSIYGDGVAGVDDIVYAVIDNFILEAHRAESRAARS